MNIKLEVYKELYKETFTKIFSMSLCNLVINDIRKQIFAVFPKEALNEFDANKFIQGETLESFREMYGHVIANNVRGFSRQVQVEEAQKPNIGLGEDKIKEVGEFIYYLIRLEYLENKLAEYRVKPFIKDRAVDFIYS